MNGLGLLTAKEVICLVNLSSRDYLREQNQWTPRIEEASTRRLHYKFCPRTTGRSNRSTIHLIVFQYLASPHPRYRSEKQQDDECEEEPQFSQEHSGGSLVLPFSVEFEDELLRIESEGGTIALEQYSAANPTHKSCVSSFFSVLLKSIGIVRFYTANEAESRAWYILEGSSILQAARVINVELERRFNYADVMDYQDFKENNGDIDIMRADMKLRLVWLSLSFAQILKSNLLCLTEFGLALLDLKGRDTKSLTVTS